MEIKGRHIADGGPRSQVLTSREVHQARPSASRASSPPSASRSSRRRPSSAPTSPRRAWWSGGGALLHDIDKMLPEQTGQPIVITEGSADLRRRGLRAHWSRRKAWGDVFVTINRLLPSRAARRPPSPACLCHDPRFRAEVRVPSHLARLVFFAFLSLVLMVQDHHASSWSESAPA